jgi:hypothetical protein
MKYCLHCRHPQSPYDISLHLLSRARVAHADIHGIGRAVFRFAEALFLGRRVGADCICALLLKRLELEELKVSLGRTRLAEAHLNSLKGVMQQFLLIEVFPASFNFKHWHPWIDNVWREYRGDTKEANRRYQELQDKAKPFRKIAAAHNITFDLGTVKKLAVVLDDSFLKAGPAKWIELGISHEKAKHIAPRRPREQPIEAGGAVAQEHEPQQEDEEPDVRPLAAQLMALDDAEGI